MGIRRKLEGDEIEIVKNLDNKRVKQEIDPRLQNHLAEGHVAARGEVQSLIPDSPTNRVPQLKLARNETQLLVRETRDLFLTDIL